MKQLVSRLRDLASDVGPDWSPAAGRDYGQHGDLLRELNGCTFHHGTVRILGCRDDLPSLDLETWNDPSTWTFAWPASSRPDGYAIFGETAWGDQYAYRGTWAEPEGVYILESTYLEPLRLADTLEQFLDEELLRVAQAPYDRYTVEALAEHGPVDARDHWAFVPSLVIGGEPDVHRVTTMGAVDAMVVNGDVLAQYEAAEDGSVVVGLEDWTDDRGRRRARLVTRRA